MSLQAQLVFDSRDTLGEGPVWYSGSLWWVDIEGKALRCFDPTAERCTTSPLEKRPGCAVPCESGRWLIANEEGLAFLNIDDEKMDTFDPFLVGNPRLRFNDGKCDPVGRLLVGTLEEDLKEGGACLYRLDTDGKRSVLLEGVTISNGLAWSGDGRTLYYIDTLTRSIERFEYELSSGSVSSRRCLVTVPEQDGFPDGMAIDSEGHLWVALWGGGAVQRFHCETGEKLDRVDVPVSQVTSCCFGGESMDTLFITTARIGLSKEDLAKQPRAGSVFSCQTSVAGRLPRAYNDKAFL